MATLTVYPDAGTGGTTVDGYATATGLDVTFANLITSAGTGKSDTGTSIEAVYFYSGSGLAAGHWARISRGIFTFDTSPLTAGATISAAVMSLYGTSKLDNGTAISHNIDIYTSTPASNNAIVNADLLQVGSVSQTGSPISQASFNDAGYNDFTFSILTNINKTGISRFGTRNANYDVAAVAPTWSDGKTAWFLVKSADTIDTTNDPKLVITYTPPAVGPANMKSYNTNLAANVKSINTNLIANVKTLDTNV